MFVGVVVFTHGRRWAAVQAAPLLPAQHSALMEVYNAIGCGGACVRFAAGSNCTGPAQCSADGFVTDLHVGLMYDALSGTLPTAIGVLSRLTALRIKYTALRGALPTQIGQLRALTRLEAFGTSIAGPLPSEIGNWRNITYLWFSDGVLSGTLPTEVGLLTALTELSVKINRLTGTLPTELLRLTAVQHLLLYLNNWTGPVPPNLGGSSVTFDCQITRPNDANQLCLCLPKCCKNNATGICPTTTTTTTAETTTAATTAGVLPSVTSSATTSLLPTSPAFVSSSIGSPSSQSLLAPAPPPPLASGADSALTWALVGAALGCVALVALALAALCFVRQRHRREQQHHQSQPPHQQSMSSTTTAADQTTMVSARDSPATSIGGGHYDNVPAALPLAAHYKSLSAAHEPAHSDVYSDGLPDDD